MFINFAISNKKWQRPLWIILKWKLMPPKCFDMQHGFTWRARMNKRLCSFDSHSQHGKVHTLLNREYSYSVQVTIILTIWYLRLQPPTLWVVCGQKQVKRLHVSTVQLSQGEACPVLRSTKRFHNFGYAFKEVARWLSIFRFKHWLTVTVEVAGQTISNTCVTSLQICIVVSEGLAVFFAKYTTLVKKY